MSPHIDTETLLANASEDLLSISTIAADLADDVDDSRRCVALAISRMADGVQLLVERALDHLETKEMAAHSAKGWRLHRGKLSRRHREQARSHRGIGLSRIPQSTQNNCGSELARDSAVSGNNDAS